MKKGHANLVSEDSYYNSPHLRDNTETRNVKRNIPNILKNFICFILFIVSYYLYYLSLEKCYEGNDGCTKKMKWIANKVIEELVSCIFVSLLIELMFYKIISKLHLIHFVLTFAIFYKYSHGMDFDNHGYFNFILYFIICFFL